MNVKAKIAGVQLECALFRWNHVKALFVKYVKGCGFFYVHVSECAPRSVAKKNCGDGEEEYDNCTTCFIFERGKKIETEKKN